MALSSYGVDQGLVDLRAVDDDADYASEDVAQERAYRVAASSGLQELLGGWPSLNEV